MEFIGQQKLLNILNNYTIATLPHSILLLGDEGSGKKTLVKYLANKLGLELIFITDDITADKLTEYQHRAVKTVYLIDLSQFNLEKEQNAILKFIEEPSETTYIILINTSEIGILPTVINRCRKLRVEPYSVMQLKQIKNFNNDLAYKICKTPGQLQDVDEKKLADLYNLCETIVNKSTIASYSNMISIAPRINYKEDYNKFGFEAFLNMLEYVASNKFFENNDETSLKIYLYVIKRRQELLQNSKIQKEAFMINVLDGLWKEVR